MQSDFGEKWSSQVEMSTAIAHDYGGLLDAFGSKLELKLTKVVANVAAANLQELSLAIAVAPCVQSSMIVARDISALGLDSKVLGRIVADMERARQDLGKSQAAAAVIQSGSTGMRFLVDFAHAGLDERLAKELGDALLGFSQALAESMKDPDIQLTELLDKATSIADIKGEVTRRLKAKGVTAFQKSWAPYAQFRGVLDRAKNDSVNLARQLVTIETAKEKVMEQLAEAGRTYASFMAIQSLWGRVSVGSDRESLRASCIAALDAQGLTCHPKLSICLHASSGNGAESSDGE